jgi:hypothetical protein
MTMNQSDREMVARIRGIVETCESLERQLSGLARARDELCGTGAIENALLSRRDGNVIGSVRELNYLGHAIPDALHLLRSILRSAGFNPATFAPFEDSGAAFLS